MTATMTATMTASSDSTPCTHHIMTFDEAMLARHSSRRFLPTPVPKEIIRSALDLATNSPSNSNTQPWRLYILSGPAADRLKASVRAAADANPVVPATPLPQDYQRFRFELGKAVYSEALGIAREDKASRRAAQLRNYDFYGAPTTAIVCMDRGLLMADALGVGMYLQSLLLGLTEDGVNSCLEVSVTSYPDAIRSVVDIPENMEIICGLAIGYEDPAEKVNQVKSVRQTVEETTVMIEE